MIKSILPGALAIAMLAAWPGAQQQPPPAAPQQPSEIETTISGEGDGTPTENMWRAFAEISHTLELSGKAMDASPASRKPSP